MRRARRGARPHPRGRRPADRPQSGGRLEPAPPARASRRGPLPAGGRHVERGPRAGAAARRRSRGPPVARRRRGRRGLVGAGARATRSRSQRRGRGVPRSDQPLPSRVPTQTSRTRVRGSATPSAWRWAPTSVSGRRPAANIGRSSGSTRSTRRSSWPGDCTARRPRREADTRPEDPRGESGEEVGPGPGDRRGPGDRHRKACSASPMPRAYSRIGPCDRAGGRPAIRCPR